MGKGGFGGGEPAAVGKAVRRDVDDAHHQGGRAEGQGAVAQLPGQHGRSIKVRGCAKRGRVPLCEAPCGPFRQRYPTPFRTASRQTTRVFPCWTRFAPPGGRWPAFPPTPGCPPVRGRRRPSTA